MMRNRRCRQAGFWMNRCRAKILFPAAVLAVLLVCTVLPVRAQTKAEELCFPLDTAQYRVSDGYGWQSGMVVQAYRSTSYGTCLRVLHADDSAALYAHLQYAYARPGEVVKAGQLLGTAGQSGRATGTHLHFELHRQGTPCDPAGLLGIPDAVD